jgi:hypothetical protein
MRQRGVGLVLLLCLGAARPALPAEQLQYRQAVSGQTEVRLQNLVYPWLRSWVPVKALGLVNPRAKVTPRGLLAGAIALKAGRRGFRNSKFLRHAPRVACAAFVSWVLRQVGIRRLSNSASALYSLLRKQRGRLVASQVSTHYAPLFQYLRPGDCLFFWKGRRISHTEVYVGGGMTVGTSSSMLRVGVRKVGNRGFARFSVVRI